MAQSAERARGRRLGRSAGSAGPAAGPARGKRCPAKGVRVLCGAWLAFISLRPRLKPFLKTYTRRPCRGVVGVGWGGGGVGPEPITNLAAYLGTSLPGVRREVTFSSTRGTTAGTHGGFGMRPPQPAKDPLPRSRGVRDSPQADQQAGRAGTHRVCPVLRPGTQQANCLGRLTSSAFSPSLPLPRRPLIACILGVTRRSGEVCCR